MVSPLLILSLGLVNSSSVEQCAYPGGQCWELKMQKCKGSQNWTLHGLWPEWGNGCEGPDFDMNALRDIRQDLQSKWPSCPEYGESEDKFWRHEWQKHGTCSGLNELNYFQTALRLHDQFAGQCSSERSICQVCFSKDLQSQESCPSQLGSVSEVIV